VLAGLVGLELAQLPGEVTQPRVAVRDDDMIAAVAGLVGELHQAPIRQRRHRRPRDVAQRLLVVQRRAEDPAGLRQHPGMHLGALDRSDVRGDRDRRRHPAVAVRQWRDPHLFPA